MRMPIDTGAYAGNTECAAMVCYARPDADTQAMFREMLDPQDAAKIYWPAEAARGWVVPPAYRLYSEPGGNCLVPAVFDEAGSVEPAHLAIGLYAVGKGTPARDALTSTPDLR